MAAIEKEILTKTSSMLKIYDFISKNPSYLQKLVINQSLKAQERDTQLWLPKTHAIVFVGGSSVGKTSITQSFKNMRPYCQVLARDALYMERMVKCLSDEPGFSELYNLLGNRIFYALMYNKLPFLVMPILETQANSADLIAALSKISVPYYANASAISLEMTYKLVLQLKSRMSRIALFDSVIMGEEFRALTEVCPVNVVIYTTFEKIVEHVTNRNENAIKQDNIRNWRPPLAVLYHYSCYFASKRPDGGNEFLGSLDRKTVMEHVMQLHQKEPWHLLPQYRSIGDYLENLLKNFGFQEGQNSLDLYPRYPSKLIIKTSELTPMEAANMLNNFVKYNITQYNGFEVNDVDSEKLTKSQQMGF